MEEKFERRLSEELGKIRVEIRELKVELIERQEALRAEMIEMNERLRAEMVEMNERLRAEMVGMNGNLRAELIKWMFIFWVGQVGMILGILFAFFK